MRTTVTLDPDVEKMIREAMRVHELSFKEALNRAVRMGMKGLSSNDRTNKRYRLKPRKLGLRSDELPSHLMETLEEEEERLVRSADYH